MKLVEVMSRSRFCANRLTFGERHRIVQESRSTSPSRYLPIAYLYQLIWQVLGDSPRRYNYGPRGLVLIGALR